MRLAKTYPDELDKSPIRPILRSEFGWDQEEGKGSAGPPPRDLPPELLLSDIMNQEIKTIIGEGKEVRKEVRVTKPSHSHSGGYL